MDGSKSQRTEQACFGGSKAEGVGYLRRSSVCSERRDMTMGGRRLLSSHIKRVFWGDSGSFRCSLGSPDFCQSTPQLSLSCNAIKVSPKGW